MILINCYLIEIRSSERNGSRNVERGQSRSREASLDRRIVRALEVRRRAREDGRREAEDERGGRIQGHAAESICHLFSAIPDL